MIEPQSGGGLKCGASWFVRAVALLLVAVALQSGSFGEPADARKWYFGSPDHSSAVLSEPRKAHAKRAEADSTLDNEPAPGANNAPAAAPLRLTPVLVPTRLTPDAPRVARNLPQAPRLLPDPTGPPRA